MIKNKAREIILSSLLAVLLTNIYINPIKFE